MRNLIVIGLLVVISVLLTACGGSVSPASTALPKQVNIKLNTNPSPVRVGDAGLVLMITDASGNPIEGAQVDVSADHTEMAGMSMGGAASKQSNGRYAIKANFSMSGKWKLTVYVRKNDLDYKQEMELPVQ